MELTDSYGDGWNNARIQFVDEGGDVVYTDTLEEGYGKTSIIDIEREASATCYHVEVIAGDYPGEVGWTLIVNGLVVQNGGAPWGPQQVCLLGPLASPRRKREFVHSPVHALQTSALKVARELLSSYPVISVAGATLLAPRRLAGLAVVAAGHSDFLHVGVARKNSLRAPCNAHVKGSANRLDFTRGMLTILGGTFAENRARSAQGENHFPQQVFFM